MNFPIKIILFLFISFSLASCASGPTPTKLNPDEAELLFARGEYQKADALFLDLARQLRPYKRTLLLLRATAAEARMNNLAKAKRTLQGLKINYAKADQRLLLRLTQAHLALMQRQVDKVLKLLAVPPPAGSNHFYLADYYDLRADAFNLSGNRIETARELIKRERYLGDAALIHANQQDIWQALAMLTEQALMQLRTDPPPNVLSGWMDLVRIAKTYQLRPAMLRQAVQRWQHTYPQHPADQQIIQGLLNRQQQDVSLPKQIALLLPFSSKFGKAAEAIRDGFLGAYYARHMKNRQSIHIYDVSNSDVTTVYQQALAQGADFVVGPLDKAAIARIASQNPLPVPTLALNYSQGNNIPVNLYQFGLSPEDEARQVAERTWFDGYVNAVTLVPTGPWGERVVQAFTQRWREIGGQIVNQETYNSANKDFSRPIRRLLNIDQSRRRYRSLSGLLNRKLKYTSRRRQDIDFVFIAAYPRQARQIRPQLKFYHAASVPVYATSHVFTGNLNPARDRDMDGLIFGDMPWVLTDNNHPRSLRSKIEPQISRVGHSFQRLYALGIDAYNIIAVLNTLKKYPYERFDGETGSLRLDLKQQIHRQLTWVKFVKGRPVRLDQGI
ncbi:MAG: ABC transporter substrate-binding protein [Gammaproteobacteria bacterium]|nr:ABC transporter substrate-binding protein [Gammaproteobacteria bacterium]